DPVSAAKILVATARETRGPPPMPSTQSRTISNAGRAATTAPKPTRLATLITGRTAAFAPASTEARKSGKRVRFRATTTRIATNSAIETDQIPPTAVMLVDPHCGLARNAESILGRTTCAIRKLVPTTTASGKTARLIGGRV